MTLAAQGPSLSTFLIYLYTTIPFVIETWEEYFVGGLFLPEINGPVEGLLALAACQLIAFFYGQQVYFLSFAEFIAVAIGQGASASVSSVLPIFIAQAPLWKVCTNVLLTFSVLTTFLSLFLVNRAVRKNGSTLINALPPLIPFILVLVSGILWINTTAIFAEHTFLFLFTIGFAIAYFCNRVTLAFILYLPINDTITDPIVGVFAALFVNICVGFLTKGFVFFHLQINILDYS
jgi:hypothetical protein